MNKDYTNMCFIGICFVFQYVLDVLTKNIFVKVMWLSLSPYSYTFSLIHVILFLLANTDVF